MKRRPKGPWVLIADTWVREVEFRDPSPTSPWVWYCGTELHIGPRVSHYRPLVFATGTLAGHGTGTSTTPPNFIGVMGLVTA
jgi:hypothetical protein